MDIKFKFKQFLYKFKYFIFFFIIIIYKFIIFFIILFLFYLHFFFLLLIIHFFYLNILYYLNMTFNFYGYFPNFINALINSDLLIKEGNYFNFFIKIFNQFLIYLSFIYNTVLGPEGLIVQIFWSLTSFDDFKHSLGKIKILFYDFYFYFITLINDLLDYKVKYVLTLMSKVWEHKKYDIVFFIVLILIFIIFFFFIYLYNYFKYQKYNVNTKKYCTNSEYKNFVLKKGIAPKNVSKFILKTKQKYIFKYFNFYVKKGLLSEKEFNYLIYKKLMPLKYLKIYVKKKYNFK